MSSDAYWLAHAAAVETPAPPAPDTAADHLAARIRALPEPVRDTLTALVAEAERAAARCAARSVAAE